MGGFRAPNEPACRTSASSVEPQAGGKQQSTLRHLHFRNGNGDTEFLQILSPKEAMDMRSALALILLATIVTVCFAAAALAQNDDDGGDSDDNGYPPNRVVMTREEYVKDTQERWGRLQQHLLNLHNIALSKPLDLEARKKVEPLTLIINGLFNRWCEKAPPKGLEKFDDMFAALILAATYLGDLICYQGDVYQPDNYAYAIKKLNRLQKELVEASAVVGGFKPLCANWLSPGASIQQPAELEILKYIDGFPAERSTDPPLAVLNYTKNGLLNVQREWEAQRERHKRTDFDHYYRLLCHHYRNIGTLEHNEVPQELVAAARAAIIATYEAMKAASQNGQVNTAEMDRLTINFQANILLWMAGQ
ncbi:hypothetical protein AUJ40_00800 [Candidatus Berkelbacteria bacterium CG1_02_42_45]|uniref:Uncharacterized protein n=1 Tax=Candidatus Berkelbacteria bacterium CG1_02_42_45 TaxID=1805036 RepID=A0A1J4RSV3_9BACT|nr:MAG: hypothetical protein AUJ40_00800 [Candidatus Berkelbacteria bacterium CG1_02_42_45]